MKELSRKILKHSLILFFVSTFASGALAFTYAGTKERIEKQKYLQQVEAVIEAFPLAESPKNVRERKDLGTRAKKIFPMVEKVFEISKKGEKLGYAFVVLPRGYGGPMNVVVGINLKGKVTGLKVSDHRETPGLGTDVVENPEYIKEFKNKTARDPVEIGKDVDVISGSTISSKALASGVREALKAFTKLAKGDK